MSYPIFFTSNKQVPENHLQKYIDIVGIDEIQQQGNTYFLNVDHIYENDQGEITDEEKEEIHEYCRILNAKSQRLFKVYDGSCFGKVYVYPKAPSGTSLIIK